MDNFDKLKTCSIKDGVQYLAQYANFITQDHISDKAHYFFANLPEVFYLIFGYENQPGY